MIHQKLSSAVRYAQSLANRHGMAYTVVCASTSGGLYRVRVGDVLRSAQYGVLVHPQKG